MWNNRKSHSLLVEMQNCTAALGESLVVSHSVFLIYSWIKPANIVTGFSEPYL